MQLGALALVQDDDAVLLARECGIEQFARQQAARVRQHEDDRTELAALGFVNRQRIGEFEDRIAFFHKVTTGEVVLEAWL